MHRRQLPILDPCSEDYEAMTPEGTSRRCARCQTSVHDLSAMSRAEARRFLLRHRGQQVCMRYRWDAHGEVLFRPASARVAGPLSTALAGLLAACTGPTGIS